MNNITNSFGTLYYPKKALVVYEGKGQQQHTYVESYDMDSEGYPINAHPLSMRESIALAKLLDTSDETKRSFLKPKGLLPPKVLYINPDHNGYAVWHTPQQVAKLLFTDDLGIPNGEANVPPLLWKASKDTLQLFAIADDSPLSEETPLCHAPFFNVYRNGKVCMGTVAVNISSDCHLEDFIGQWENYFFNSYFSHLFAEHVPIKGNIVQLWKSLVGKTKRFPLKSLINNGFIVKNLLQ